MALRYSVFLLLFLGLQACAPAAPKDDLQLGRLSDGTILIYQEPDLTIITPAGEITRHSLSSTDFAMDQERMACLSRGRVWDLIYTNGGLVRLDAAAGRQLDPGEGTWLVREGGYINILSNQRQVNFYLFEEEYDQAGIWNSRFLMTHSAETLKVWNLREDGAVTLHQVFTNVQDFALHGEQPLVFLTRNSNQFYSYMIYANELTLIDTLPFPVSQLEYDLQSRMAMLAGMGVAAFYHLDSGRIEMGQVMLDRIYYDNRRSQLLILVTNTVQIMDFSNKQTIATYHLK